MRRRPFTLSLSLLLCVAICVVWVRSYWRSDVLCMTRVTGSAYDGTSRERWVQSNRGAIRLCINTESFHYVQRSETDVLRHISLPIQRSSHPANAERNETA